MSESRGTPPYTILDAKHGNRHECIMSHAQARSGLICTCKRVCILAVIAAGLLLTGFKNPILPDPAQAPAMTYTQAVVLGITEGLTEYLPVSSTGHLYLAAHLMGLNDKEQDKPVVDAYVIAIQIGAIAAVLWLYFARILQMLRGALGRDPAGRALFLNTLAAFVPAVIIGITFERPIKRYLFGIWPITLAWFLGGLAILYVAGYLNRHDQKGRALEGLTLKQAVIIGLIQCIAMWPGVSRSLVTILGGVLVGLSLPAAVEFSFLLGLITLGGATCYELFKEGPHIIALFGWMSPAIGLITAFLSAVIAVKWMVAYLNKHGLQLFGYYRIILAAAALVMILRGAL